MLRLIAASLTNTDHRLLLPTGKTYTMIGSDQSPGSLGVMPCAIAWLFKIINEQKDKTGARFSVRVSAVQVTGKEEVLRDLLIDMAQGRIRTRLVRLLPPRVDFTV